MRVAVLREDAPTERRVALTPEGATKLIAGGHLVAVEEHAGQAAGHPDREYIEAGVTVGDRSTTVGHEGVLVSIDPPSSVDGLGSAHTLVGMLDPLWAPKRSALLAGSGATLVSLELIPRITRAQSMDVLSSMATVAGYEAVLLAASTLPAMFPMLMTAAGTVPAARVVVLGAGVAGLQAIATARRLGAVVEAYDVRPAAAEQIRSMGAKAIELDLDTSASEDSGGYAKEQGADAERRQQDQLAPHLAASDIVITTAAIPGRASPLLITTSMVEQMTPGSVIVDLAAERGGNCEVTVTDQEVQHGLVTVLGPTDLASRSARSASRMFSNNVVTLLQHLAPEDDLVIDMDDEITAGIVVARGGSIVDKRVTDALATQ